jgi:acetyltransferase-like isoleucine patch superfamily enzyme
MRTWLGEKAFSGASCKDSCHPAGGLGEQTNYMLEAYLSAAFQTWAAAKTRKNWRGFWRLKKLGISWQLKKVQNAGSEIELTGPVIIQNAGMIEIGNQVEFGANWYKPVFIQVARPEARLTIENNVYINYGTEISLVKEVFIGAYSLIGIDCLIYDTDWHSLDGLDRDIPIAPTRIGRGVWLGARVIVMKGITIGDNTVVAANSVVTNDLPDNVLAGGSPARVIRAIERSRYRQSSIPDNSRGA